MFTDQIKEYSTYGIALEVTGSRFYIDQFVNQFTIQHKRNYSIVCTLDKKEEITESTIDKLVSLGALPDTIDIEYANIDFEGFTRLDFTFETKTPSYGNFRTPKKESTESYLRWCKLDYDVDFFTLKSNITQLNADEISYVATYIQTIHHNRLNPTVEFPVLVVEDMSKQHPNITFTLSKIEGYSSCVQKITYFNGEPLSDITYTHLGDNISIYNIIENLNMYLGICPHCNGFISIEDIVNSDLVWNDEQRIGVMHHQNNTDTGCTNEIIVHLVNDHITLDIRNKQ